MLVNVHHYCLQYSSVKFDFCQVCTERILKRGQSSGRTDDNIESLRKRFNTYTKETVPIVRHYDQLEKVRKINGGTGRTPDEVLHIHCISFIHRQFAFSNTHFLRFAVNE